MTLEQYMRELWLMDKQYGQEEELYPLINMLLRDGANTEKLSIRDVHNAKRFCEKSLRKYINGFGGYPDLAIWNEQFGEKEDEKVEITFAMNEDSIATNKAVTMFTLTIKEEGKNKGTVTLKANIDEAASSVTITAKYSIDYNAKVEPKNVRNSINANDLTEEDMNEMMTNIENNEFLYSIIQSLSTTRLMEKAEENAKRYEEEQIEREQLQEELLNTELTENI